MLKLKWNVDGAWFLTQVLTEYPPASHTHAGFWPATLSPAPSASSSETWRNSPET
jgi:hypothetical protein